MTPTLLFLLGTVAVACNGAVIKGRPCEHHKDEAIQAEPVLVNIPEAPMLPPFSSNALEFVAPLQDEIKPETPSSLPTVPLSYQPVSFVSGDYAWPTASIYPNYPVNVLSGQAALDYPNVQIVPITNIAQRPCEHASGSSTAATPVLLPYYVPAWAPETESKPVFTSFPEAPILPSFSLSELPLTNTVANDEAPANEEKIDAGLMIIPEAPILPPFVAPEMPKEEITETPMDVEMPSPCEKEVELISIPEAPVLPAFVAPEFPISAEPEEPAKEENCDEPATQSEALLVIIPEAPVLPPFTAPAALPIAPMYDEPKTETAAPCEELKEEKYETYVPIVIPTAPVLPPFVAPEFPMMEEEKETLPASTEAPVLCDEPEEEKYETYVPIAIPTAPVLPPFVAPEIPMMEEEKETLPVSTEAPVLCDEPENEPQQFIPIPEAPLLPTFIAPEMSAAPMYEEPKYEEPQQYIHIPTAPILPTFVAPEMPAVPMYDEPKSEDCDKDKEYKPVPVAYPYYLPIPATYALSKETAPALPESSESIAECIRKILANRVSPSFYANLIPAAQDMRAPMVPLRSPFYYKPSMSDLPVY